MFTTWDEALAQLKTRRADALKLGGQERIDRQHQGGRLTIRERVAQLCDRFVEIGGLAKYTELDEMGREIGKLPSSYVSGLAEIDGRPVALGGEDFTVRAGAPQLYLDRMKGGMGGFVEDLAYEYKIPLVLLCEGIGGDVAMQYEKGHSYLVSSSSWKRSFDLLSEVPVVTAVLGAAAGGTAARAVMSHFSVMSKNSVLFAGGPPVVRRALGMDVNKADLGGTAVHTEITGAIDNFAEDEDDALAQVRSVLGYLPTNTWTLPPRGDRTDPVDRSGDELLAAMPENRRQPYDAHALIKPVVDCDSFFEVGGRWGRSLLAGFARLDGIPVGVLASNPIVLGGALDAAAAQKQVRFVDMCSLFHLPLVYFVDVPGFMIGPDAERASVVRHGVRAIQSIVDARVPIVTIHVRKAYGMAVAATSNPDRLGLRLAWPTAEWGDMPPEGGVEAGYRRILDAAENREDMRRDIEKNLLDAADPWKTVEAFGVEDMIDPRETRSIICAFLNASLHAMATSLGPHMRPRGISI